MFQCWDVLFWDVLIMGSYYREIFGICVSRLASTVVISTSRIFELVPDVALAMLHNIGC